MCPLFRPVESSQQGCATGDKKLRNKGLTLMARNTSKMIAADGSVREGSLIYSRNTYKWTQQQIARIRGCGVRVPAELLRADRTPTSSPTAFAPIAGTRRSGMAHQQRARRRMHLEVVPSPTWRPRVPRVRFPRSRTARGVLASFFGHWVWSVASIW